MDPPTETPEITDEKPAETTPTPLTDPVEEAPKSEAPEACEEAGEIVKDDKKIDAEEGEVLIVLF